ncbi:prolyl oligopeptidase family serine peptidase [Kibdelosporangium persicum]|uniref:Dipeptidyl aminopeptidase/acylaminoacyl peptidase n=1 Tax=Kibdelosporangium persicum TaxID=2698649 RepID=A0ABX2F3M0_9PSEU|nr:prolyl oligopeptidase family serine peptidase [Kibdelosporangium persicum]NRN65430.1 Dipeptidyl aminopeptidase/acylaminoacyl peptidase [Kibdelosporangium persicum]
MVEIASYGTWASPITAAEAAAVAGGPDWVDLYGPDVWWTETRPSEGGRIALMRSPAGGQAREVLDARWSVRNRVHEYGSRSWVVLHDRVVFTNWDDQRVYEVPWDGGEPKPVTPEPDREHGWRYGDLTAGPDGQVWCVRETVTGDAPTDVRRDLVALTGGQVRVLGASHHFLSGPRISPDGRHAAWIGWDHPWMPWDRAELCVAPLLADGTFGAHRVVAGGPREAVCQFAWEDGATLLALTDPDGWWNLFRIGIDGTARNLAPCAEELGGPLWRLGSRWFTPLGSGRFAVLRAGGSLAILDERSRTVTDVDTDLTVWRADLIARDGMLYGAAGTASLPTAVVSLDLSRGELATYSPQEAPFDPDVLPEPRERMFGTVPAYVYPPANPGFAAPAGEKPPYVVFAHGGPTGKYVPTLNLGFAYLTSRGIGVVAVNYGGSTGYGRVFRESLHEQWGVVDVDDCASVARTLAEEGTADPARLAIMGGSAGGWTAASSITSTRVYACATILYPVLDLVRWTAEGGETHDFESRYLESLVGPWPRERDRYTRRSPVNHVGTLAGPVLLMQGLEDRICPPQPAERFVAAIAGTGVAHAYLAFAGEQHGFRKAETQRAALEAQLSFYGQVFGFTPPGVPVLQLRS